MKKNKKNLYLRFLIGFLVLVALVGIGVLVLAWPKVTQTPQQQGVTFSQFQAQGLGLDWKAVYQATLTELGVKRLRLVAYWPIIEPKNDLYTFRDLDYQMDEASKNNATVILSIGRKVPRWPECHIPLWATSLPESEQQQAVLDLMTETINRYKGHSALTMWQLENEPLLDFGNCPPADEKFLRQQEALIRQLDPNHPILITDSGELNYWIEAGAYGDMVGTTMYRTVHSSRLNDYWHYDYIYPAWLYRLKSRLVKVIRGKDVLISELQGEPWASAPFQEVPDEERARSFSPERFTEVANFAQRTQLPAAYWWGVEYWYWEKEVRHNEAFWQIAQTIF